MTDANVIPLSLDDAKKLVEHLENGNSESATELWLEKVPQSTPELFAEVGKLTRQLHDSLNNFQLDSRIVDLAKSDIPEAQSRLTYVIETTEQAANATMDAVEKSMPIAEKIHQGVADLLPEWKKLLNRQLELGDFKVLCTNLDKLLEESLSESEQLNTLLTEVLMAQGYQDLTGQVIRRVIELVKEVEDSLVNMLTVFGEPEAKETEKKQEKADVVDEKLVAEGPIIDADVREDVVSSQNDVDDLLSSLGF